MPQAPRISTALWEARKPRITELYVNQDKTLDEVIQIMADSGFHATKPQYIRKVNVNWKLQKNYTKEKWQHASALVEKRQAEGKLTKLSIDGKVISEKKRKKEMRRYHVPQVEEEFVSPSTYGVVACTPPSSNSRVVLVNCLPWLKFRESLNNLVRSQPPQFSSNQQNGPIDFSKAANPLLSVIHTTGEMATASLPLPEPPRSVSDKVLKLLDNIEQRLFELLPMLDNHMEILQHQEPPWLQIFNSLVFLFSNNLMATESSAYELLQVAISSGFLIKMKHILTTRGPTVEVFAVHLLFAALGFEGSKGRGFMRFLLESGVSPDSVDPNGCRYSVLHRAVRLEDHAAVQLLLHFGADPDATNKETLGSPLSHAVNLRHGETIVDMLIDAGADPNYGPDKPLIQAARKFNLKVVRRLLEAGADPRLLPIGGLSMIYFAIGGHDLNLVNMLIEAGASSNTCINQLQNTDLLFLRNEVLVVVGQILTPIQFAVYTGAADIVKRLIRNGAVLDEYIEPEILERMGSFLHSGSLTPLQLSVQGRKDEITRILLDAGASIDFRHPTEATALQMACGLRNEYESTELVEYLLSQGANIDALPGEDGGRTSMQTAAERGDYELLGLLLSKGGDPLASSPERNGIALFRAALNSGSVQFVDYVFSELLSRGANLNCVDGTNYLAEAISLGNMKLIETVMMSWKRLGLQWSKEFLLSAIKIAICKGLTDVIELLDPDLSCIQQEDICPMICESIWYGDQRTFDLLMQRSVKSQLDCAQRGYPPPLWLALHQGNHYMAQRLIDAGANPNQQPLAICRLVCCGQTVLEIPVKRVIYRFHGRFIEMPADKGADIHSLIDGSQAPLLVSLEKKNESEAVYLLSEGADPNAVNPLDGRTALELALEQVASLSTVQSLIDYGADVNTPSRWGTPLVQVARWSCLQYDTIERCQLLLKAGADVNASTGSTALEIAVNRNMLGLAKLLIEAGADVNVPKAGTTALEVAVHNDNTDLATLLVEAGASLNTSSVQTSALKLAVSNNNLELAALLLAKGADINDSTVGATVLQRAANLGNLELVKHLIDRGADVDATAPGSFATALQFAAMNGSIEIVKHLVKHGASINAEVSPYYGASALGLAVAHGHTESVIYLIEKGASIDKCPSADGATLLQFAAKHGNHEIVTYLVENAMAVNAEPATKRGATALQFAAINGNIKMAIFLVENGARVSAKGAEVDGRTALEGAAEHGRLDMVHLLLNNDEEPDTIEERCCYAAKFAEAQGHDVIARILRNYKRP